MSTSTKPGANSTTKITTSSTMAAAASTNVAVAPSAKQQSQNAAKMHRRSRSGCFTCRLRRKKCDEGKPGCKACRHLGLKCEYKRPMWWSNNEQRRAQKELIKNIIKRTKLSEKAQQQSSILNSNLHHIQTPPSLCHSVQTADSYSDNMMRTRGTSIESQYSYDQFSTPMQAHDLFNANAGMMMMMPMQHQNPFGVPFVPYTPYEVDIKTERQMFVNDIPTRKDSTISTFSSFQPPMASAEGFPAESNWPQQEYFEQHHHESIQFADEPLNMPFLDFQVPQQSPMSSPPQPQQPHVQPLIPAVEVEECDQHLLDHFLNNVAPLIFPVIEAERPGSARNEIIVPALEADKTYLHCCLSIAALHLKSVQGVDAQQCDNDVMRHKFDTINELCQALSRDTNHMNILEATLGLIFFQCAVGKPDDSLPDIPWHQHFQAATSLIHKLELPAQMIACASAPGISPAFNMSVSVWIDILGGTMLGRIPCFANTYRETNVAGGSAGLAELMGCDDRIMFLISEIACLDALRNAGMDTVTLCNHIRMLGDQISLTESPLTSPLSSPPIGGSSSANPQILRNNNTAIFRVAARIYLCSLLPDFDYHASHIVALVSTLTSLLATIPPSANLDRAIVWPMLIAGAFSTPTSDFRRAFIDRMAIAGDQGSLGQCAELLKSVWEVNDGVPVPASRMHWRDVMRSKGVDWLII